MTLSLPVYAVGANVTRRARILNPFRTHVPCESMCLRANSQFVFRIPPQPCYSAYISPLCETFGRNTIEGLFRGKE